MENFLIFLNKCPSLKEVIGYNQLTKRPSMKKNSKFAPDIQIKNNGFKDLDDKIISQLRAYLASTYSAEFNKDIIFDAVLAYSLSNAFNPLKDSLERYQKGWDKTKRLENWLIEICGAVYANEDEKKYLQAVGTKVLISAVARVFKPGCKVDTVLILEGNQGIKKSSLVTELALGYGLEFTERFDKIKECVSDMLGKWIIELPELKSLQGDQDTIKSFLSKREDTVRLSYARSSEDHPRSSIFIGTTNNSEYLKDQTGNRRFFPIKITKCDLNKLKTVLKQLWGEAVHLFKQGETWWFDESNADDNLILETAHQLQTSKIFKDEKEEEVKEYLESNNLNIVNSKDIWIKVFGGTNEFKKSDQMRISTILKNIGFERKIIKGKRNWVKK